MPITPEQAKENNRLQIEQFYRVELSETRNIIDKRLTNTPSGTKVDATKKTLDILQKEYEILGWYCRQYSKSYFHMELNYLEICAKPYRKNSWKEKVLTFLSKL